MVAPSTERVANDAALDASAEVGEEEVESRVVVVDPREGGPRAERARARVVATREGATDGGRVAAGSSRDVAPSADEATESRAHPHARALAEDVTPTGVARGARAPRVEGGAANSAEATVAEVASRATLPLGHGRRHLVHHRARRAKALQRRLALVREEQEKLLHVLVRGHGGGGGRALRLLHGLQGLHRVRARARER